MKSNLTEIGIVLDESGSMSVCKKDTIGGVNEFLQSQRKVKGDANVTLVKFSDYYKIINDGTPIQHVAELNEDNYTPSNTTALLDAVGKTINNIGNHLSKMSENDRPSKVIILIITDGEENASHEFSKTKVTEMITHQKEKYSWEFIFIGADINAWGAEIGISSNVNISKDDLLRSFKGLSYYTASYRSGNAINTDMVNLSASVLDTELETMYDNDKK
jgi:uncharacterized protein YegL